MAEEKKAPVRDLSTRIQETARRETGMTLPPSVVEELRAKLQSLRLTPADASKVVREVARRSERPGSTRTNPSGSSRRSRSANRGRR